MKREIYISSEIRQAFNNSLKNGRVIIFHAPCGYGKTAVCNELLRKKSVCYISARIKEAYIPKVSDEWDILVVDDFQYAYEEKFINDLYNTILNNREKRFVLLTRGKVPSWLLEFRSTGQLLTIEKDMLTFSKDDLNEYLTSFDINLKSVDISAIFHELIGYPLACRLVKDRLKKGETFNKQFVDSIRKEAYDYLEGAVLLRFDIELQRILVVLSIFSEFDIELVQIVTKEKNAKMLMQRLLTYTSMLDEVKPGHFCFIPDFQRCMQDRFSKYYSEEEKIEICKAAAKYFLDKGDIEKALFCYDQCDDYEDIVSMLENRNDFFPGTSNFDKLSKYLFRIPEERIEGSLILMQHMSIACAFNGDIEKSEFWYNKLQSMDFSEAMSRAIWLDIVLPQRDVSTLPSILDRILSINSMTLDEENKIKLYPLPLTNLNPSALNGYRDYCGIVKMFDNEAKTFEFCEKISKVTEDFSLLTLIDTAIAEYKFLNGEDVGNLMLSLIAKLKKVQCLKNYQVEFALLGLLMSNLIEVGQPEEAKKMAENLKNRFIQIKEEAFIPNINSMICRIDLYLDEIDLAGRWYRNYAPMDCVTIDTMKLHQYFTQIMVEITLGRYTPAQISLASLELTVEEAHRNLDKMQLYFLKAIAFFRQNDSNWKEAFYIGYEIAREYNFPLAISRYGKAILPLLEKIHRKEKGTFFNDVLKKTRTMAARYPMFMELHNSGNQIEPLTEAEYSVLKLICIGKSNQEICDILDIKLSTAKTHVSHILEKMGVKRRNELKYLAEKLHLIN